jgi:hypothetical protein
MEKVKMNLIPTEKSTVSLSLSDFTILIYGGVKIGKSSFCSKFPRAFFIDANSGLGGLPVFKTKKVIETWEEVIQVCKELKSPENKKRFDVVIIDTIEELYDMCLLYVCQQLQQSGVTHPSDINNGKGDFGKTWKEVNKELGRCLRSLAAWGYGRVLISHARDKDKPEDTKIYYRPNLGKGAMNYVTSMANLILYFTHEMIDRKVKGTTEIRRVNTRVIRTLPTIKYMAGCHEINGKVLPDPMPLDFDNFIACFNKLIA